MADLRVEITIKCPKCREKFKEEVARLNAKRRVTCPSCRMRFTVNAKDLTRL